MATLPDVPQNTFVTLAVLAGAGLFAYSAHLRTRVETQIHDNYRHAKVVDANLKTGEDVPSITEKSHRSA